MKRNRIVCLLLIATLLLCCTFTITPVIANASIPNDAIVLDTDYVYTPNGTRVTVYVLEEMSDAEIQASHREWDDRYPNADRIDQATRNYNCHSYAWHYQYTDDDIGEYEY